MPNNEVRAAIERIVRSPHDRRLMARDLNALAAEPAVCAFMLDIFFKDGEAPMDSMSAALKALAKACQEK